VRALEGTLYEHPAASRLARQEFVKLYDDTRWRRKAARLVDEAALSSSFAFPTHWRDRPAAAGQVFLGKCQPIKRWGWFLGR